MTPPKTIVFLVDVDDTLLDNDCIQEKIPNQSVNSVEHAIRRRFSSFRRFYIYP